MKKAIIGAVVIISVLFCGSIKVDACQAKPTCRATLYSVECGYRHTIARGTHPYYGANGYLYTCGVSDEVAKHTIRCNGCNSVLQTNVERTCSTLHSACGKTVTGLCQN